MILALWAMWSLLQLFALKSQRGHRQYINKSVWLCSNKTLFTNIRSCLDLVHRSQFADPSCNLLKHKFLFVLFSGINLRSPCVALCYTDFRLTLSIHFWANMSLLDASFLTGDVRILLRHVICRAHLTWCVLSTNSLIHVMKLYLKHTHI